MSAKFSTLYRATFLIVAAIMISFAHAGCRTNVGQSGSQFEWMSFQINQSTYSLGSGTPASGANIGTALTQSTVYDTKSAGFANTFACGAGIDSTFNSYIGGLQYKVSGGSIVPTTPLTPLVPNNTVQGTWTPGLITINDPANSGAQLVQVSGNLFARLSVVVAGKTYNYPTGIITPPLSAPPSGYQYQSLQHTLQFVYINYDGKGTLPKVPAGTSLGQIASFYEPTCKTNPGAYLYNPYSTVLSPASCLNVGIGFNAGVGMSPSSTPTCMASVPTTLDLGNTAWDKLNGKTVSKVATFNATLNCQGALSPAGYSTISMTFADSKGINTSFANQGTAKNLTIALASNNAMTTLSGSGTTSKFGFSISNSGDTNNGVAPNYQLNYAVNLTGTTAITPGTILLPLTWTLTYQ